MTVFPVAKRSKSGEHESVQAFRKKLESIADNTIPSVEELDKKLTDYLTEIRTPVPPSEEITLVDEDEQ